MDTLDQKNMGSRKAHVAEAASDLVHDGKKLAHEIYQEGLNRVNEAEDNMKEYSDQLVKKVRENPISSILIAGGIGYLLSKILK